MVRQLGGGDDQFLCYRTGEYKLHYFETPTQLKFVLLTDTRVGNMRTVLHQIWATLYVEYVVKSPLAPTEHPKGVGVANELFEGGLESFMVRYAPSSSLSILWLINGRPLFSLNLNENGMTASPHLNNAPIRVTWQRQHPNLTGQHSAHLTLALCL
jgi:hypothetical protein